MCELKTKKLSEKQPKGFEQFTQSKIRFCVCIKWTHLL